MIICRTPFRISFFGGGTDYPAWYGKHGGAVISTTIDKYCQLTCRYLPPFFDYKYRVVWSFLENRRTVDEIRHPVVREVLKHQGLERGLEVHHVGDLPARSGMGSSSAFTVGLLHALHGLQGRMPSARQLMAESIYVEQELLRETVGSQDQAAAAMGGFNHIIFDPRGEIIVQPLLLPRERLTELDSRLMLFYTGIMRTASNVASGYVSGLGGKRRQLRIMRDLVAEALEILTSERSLDEFGHLLAEAWQVKRSLGRGISNPEVDDLFERAMAAGALGGKLTGAGGGGFMLLYVPRERQPAVLAAFDELVHVPFSFTPWGSQIIFHEQERDYADLEKVHLDRRLKSFRELRPNEYKAGDRTEEFVLPRPAGETSGAGAPPAPEKEQDPSHDHAEA